MKNFVGAISLIAGSLLVGCGGGDKFSPEDSTAAQTAAVNAITTAVAASGSALTAEQASGNVSVDFTWDCQSGGTLKVAGEWSGSSSGTGAASAYYDVTGTFAGCNDGTLTMDGSLKYVFGVNSSGGSASYQYVMDGSITYGGSVTGTCEFDVNISGTASAGGGSGSASGSICGQDFSGSSSF